MCVQSHGGWLWRQTCEQHFCSCVRELRPPGVWKPGRGSAGCSSCGSDELACQRSAMSAHHSQVHRTEFGAGCQAQRGNRKHTLFLQQLVTGRRAGTGTQQNVQTVTRIIVFAKASVEDACDSSTSIGTYSLLLHSYTGRTMLEFQVKLSAKVNSLAWLRLFWQVKLCGKINCACIIVPNDLIISVRRS